MAKQEGWLGVDLDGTLAEYHGWQGPEHIGNPVRVMVERVKALLVRGREVRIFTARAADPAAVPPINRWSLEHLGRVLPVTNVKDYACVEIWDDRARRVVENTGEFAERV